MTRALPPTIADRRLDRVRALGRLLDTAIRIPGTRFRIGLDPIIGLVPGLGDLIGTVFSGYIILEAARAGVPKATLLRMAYNVGLESLVGAVPAFGDIFDAVYKANTRNIALIDRHTADPRGLVKANRRFAVLLVVGLVLLALIAIALLVIAGEILARAVGGIVS